MADTKNPADEQRYPPGCPDPDWCRGNGCYWDCKYDGDIERGEQIDRDELERG